MEWIVDLWVLLVLLLLVVDDPLLLRRRPVQVEEDFRRATRFYAAATVWDCLHLSLRMFNGT